MVLTTQACPLVGYLTDQVKRRIEGIEGIDKVNVVVLDEPWNWERFVKQRGLLKEI
jgi:serine O-acetyltransferase